MRVEGISAGRRKKRLSVLARWHFGKGAKYCLECDGPCPRCPRKIVRPRTVEGHQLWDLIIRLGDRQLRATNGILLGWDMVAALEMGAALGVSRRLITEVLPEIEPIVMAKLNGPDDDEDDIDLSEYEHEHADGTVRNG